RVAGAALHALLDRDDRDLGDQCLVQRLGHRLGPVAHDHDDALQRQLGQRIDDVQHHGATAQRVEHLGRPRAHARPLPGCQDNSDERPLLAHARELPPSSGLARGRGFEPRLRTPKDLVLPLHHPRWAYQGTAYLSRTRVSAVPERGNAPSEPSVGNETGRRLAVNARAPGGRWRLGAKVPYVTSTPYRT